ncbi:MAG: hypothetical protein M3Y28_09440, partial [Armatimonadota bacterium]|nr:hypothetical protein [Armatimonadota bacterium]
REEARIQPGSYISVMFQHTPPRIWFRPAEQQLLLQALQGVTDEEMAASLNLSQSAVKNRWRGIYDRVMKSAADLLPQHSFENGLSDQKRSKEKRRRLLNYLRYHMEELRPVEFRSGRE